MTTPAPKPRHAWTNKQDGRLSPPLQLAATVAATAHIVVLAPEVGKAAALEANRFNATARVYGGAAL